MTAASSKRWRLPAVTAVGSGQIMPRTGFLQILQKASAAAAACVGGWAVRSFYASLTAANPVRTPFLHLLVWFDWSGIRKSTVLC
jgi:hypothetical protein